jgi:transposase-like protein
LERLGCNCRFEENLSVGNRRCSLTRFDEFGQNGMTNTLKSANHGSNWSNLNTFFAYPMDIRKAIYTTNAIESLNSVIRHATKKEKSSQLMIQ